MWDGAVWPLPPEREGPGVLLQHSHRAGSPPVGLRGVLRELCGTRAEWGTERHSSRAGRLLQAPPKALLGTAGGVAPPDPGHLLLRCLTLLTLGVSAIGGGEQDSQDLPLDGTPPPGGEFLDNLSSSLAPGTLSSHSPLACLLTLLSQPL